MPTESEFGLIFCLECANEQVEERREPHIYKLKGRDVEIGADWHFACLKCGAISHIGPMLDASFRAVAEQTRCEDGLLTVDNLRSVRLRYGFKQSEMETLLGCGEKTWIRWERGKVVQSKPHDTEIRRMAGDPDYVAELMDRHGVANQTARAAIESARRRAIQKTGEILRKCGTEVPEDAIDRVVRTFREQASEAFTPSHEDEDPRQVIARHQRCFPVDVNAIAMDLGIRVYYDQGLGRDVSGRIERNAKLGGPSGYSIFINVREISERQRYTLAHEIAHFVMHKDLIGDGVTENAMHRGPFRDSDEREADAMAATIIMPENLIREAYRTHKAVGKMAELFGVSYDAMHIRLVKELKLA